MTEPYKAFIQTNEDKCDNKCCYLDKVHDRCRAFDTYLERKLSEFKRCPQCIKQEKPND